MHKDIKEVISHEEMLFTLAVAVGTHSKAGNPDQAAVAALTLAVLVTDEDLQRAKMLAKAAIQTCGCEQCLALLSKISEIETKTQTGESFSV